MTFEKFLETFNGVDIAFCAMIILGFLMGARKGLATMITKTLALFGAILTLLHYYSPAAQWVSEYTFVPRKTTEVILYVLIGMGAWMVLNLIMKIIEKFMEVKFSEGINRLGGLILGGVFFYVFVGFVIYSLLIFHIPFFQPEWASESFAAPSAIQVAPGSYKAIFGALPPEPVS